MSVISDLLVHTVTVRRSVDTWDAAGALVPTFSASTTHSVRVVPLSASDVNRFARDGYTVSHSVLFDTNPNVTNGDMVVFNGRYLYVQAVMSPDEGGVGSDWTWWDVACFEQTQQQP